MILSVPITRLILYFVIYSFLGWVLETCFCSIKARRLVPRGFLYGPVCPIYGVGVCMMILFFRPLAFSPVLFYCTAVVGMSAWECLVGWVLETTTHVRYWDYSDKPLNFHGYICLQISLCWGALSYVVIFCLHPLVEGQLGRLPDWLAYVLCGVLMTLMAVDAAFTIRQLALVSRLLRSLERATDELQLQLALGKAELATRLDAAREEGREAYAQQIARLERYTRRFRRHYSHLRFTVANSSIVEDVKAAGARALRELQRRRGTGSKG